MNLKQMFCYGALSIFDTRGISMIEETSTTLKEKLLEKSPSGINGFDDIAYGGLPKGRITLVYGSAGSGKTLMAMEFLVKGAEKYNEPGGFRCKKSQNKHVNP